MLEWLTDAVDKDIRDYSKYLSLDDGEDGYHNTIMSLLTYHQTIQPMKPAAFLRTAVKYNVHKIWRNERVYHEQMEAYVRGEGSSYWKGLQAGRKPHTHCRKGHEFTPDNIVYRGGNLSRKLCKQCVIELRKQGKHP